MRKATDPIQEGLNTLAAEERAERAEAEVERLTSVVEAARYYINKSDGSGYFALAAAVRRIDEGFRAIDE